MDQKVEGFPFNITGAPMYYGSTCSFLGTAILYERWAGVMLTVEVLVVYLVALSFEEYVAFFRSTCPPHGRLALQAIKVSGTG